MLVSEPRMLLVAVRSPSLALDVMVLHAPIESAPAEDRDAWWARARQAAARRPQQRVALVVLVDGNARLGSVLSEAVGGYDADDENCNGAALHEFMGEQGLLATNTFFESRLGTWVATSGAERRGDYVLVPQVWRAQLEDAGVTDQVSLALAAKEDHRPVVARVACHPAADEP